MLTGPAPRRAHFVRLLLALVLGLAGIAYAASPGAGDSSEGGIAATRDAQRLMSLGAEHSCAITDAGAVECWGDNSHGQLGTGDVTTSTTPRLVAGITGALEVGSGTEHTCALVHGGTVKCWGLNGSGQVGTASDDDQLIPVTVPISGVKHLTVGSVHSCAMKQDGSVWCWGQNGMGQLGDGVPGGTSKVPVPASGIDATSPAADITAGENHTCARMVAEGTLRCWGDNSFGQLGDGTKDQHDTPVAVRKPGNPGARMKGVLAVSAGGGHTCALLGGADWADNPVYCWGQNSYGQLGNLTPVVDGVMSPSLVPVRVQIDLEPGDALVDTSADLEEARSISAGQFHNCAVMNTREVRCWGQNGHGQLGFDRNILTKPWEDSRWANAVPGIDADAVVAGGFHSCSLDTGQISCWGYDFFGQLGGYVPQVPTPTTVTGVRGAKRIALANDAACALITDGITEATRPQCWGSNADGRLGIGSTSPTSSTIPVRVDLDPTQPPVVLDPIHQGREPATALHGGNGSFCATPDGIPGERCWGLNGHAELGDGTTTSRATPIAPTHLAGVTAYDLGGTLVGGIERGTTCKAVGGQARCWGYNGQRQVGDDTTTDRTAPVPVLHDPDPDDPDNPLVPITGVTAVAVGGDHACAIVGGGQVRCWGSNTVGQLGNNTTDPQAGAVTVQSDTDPDDDEPLTGVTALVAGDSHTCAMRGAGEVRCWGLNSRGQLGTSGGSRDEADKVVRALAPTPLFAPGDLTDATKIVSGDDHTCAMRASDAVTCWGENADGQLGTGGIGGFQSVGQVSLPAPTTSGLPEPWIKDIGASRRNTCAVLLDRTVSCWGDNSLGQVGDGIGTHSLAPVAVGGGASVGQNHVPTPAAISVATTPGTSVVIPVVLTGIDVDGDAVTLVSASDPPKGTSALTGPAQITYTPDAGCQDDEFAYVVSDGTAQVAATVTITMNCPPVADADSAITVEDQPVDIDVLAGDTDEDGDTLTISGFPVPPAHGTVSQVGGKARYVPALDYCGPDSFTYSVSDGHGHTVIAPVTVTVTCATDPPSAVADALPADEDTPTLFDVLANDSDPDGDPLAIVAVTAPSHGTAVKDGSRIRYVPAADYCGPDSFTYTVSDGALTSAATVTVTVVCVGDSPRAVPDSATTAEDTSVDVAVLANDTHPDGLTLSLTGALGQPVHGTATVVGTQVRYVPAADYCGPDSLTYVVTDGTLTATGTVTLTVTCTNDPPVAAPDVASTDEDVTVHVHVISNDSDVDGDVLHVGTISDPAHGAAVGAIDNAVAYTPDPNFCGTDSFTYESVDGKGGVTTGTVTVTVRCVDDLVQLAPVADVTVPWGEPVSVLLAATDIDEGAVITYDVSPLPLGASLTGPAFAWTPGAAQVGSRLLTATASSGGRTATRTFRIVVTKRATSLSWTGPTSGQISDQTPVRAVLLDAGSPVQGRSVGFALGTATTSASTDATGTATSAVQVTGALGARFVTSSFAGDAAYLPATLTTPFTVLAEGLAVQLAGTPHVVTTGSSATVTYTADLTEEQDGSYVGSLSSSTVRFKGLDGTTICTGAISATGAGKARATCSASQPLGALPVVVTVTSSAHTPRADVGVVTVAKAGAGLASGAGRVAGDAFGFTATSARKGAPTGRLVHVVLGSGQATVVDTATLSSYATTCTGGGSSKVCTATIAGTGATARTVDLASGAVSGPVAASITVTAVSTNRYGVQLGGPAPKTLAPTVLTSGAVRVD
ncbi:Ig-like domain-containing protein [Nocardioides zhouii]|uniref:Tandem-95 repeat protein n=1 Tax=Nocardioides zhouii TaxID=1168729 RepID=A0A4Q2SYZ4_9ACTN|nr:Ig-like domain-containing protein [Nocardioides zhouii]RYC11455.1 tandem-95 repeat protein [Nocardioides zhouii]